MRLLVWLCLGLFVLMHVAASPAGQSSLEGAEPAEAEDEGAAEGEGADGDDDDSCDPNELGPKCRYDCAARRPELVTEEGFCSGRGSCSVDCSSSEGLNPAVACPNPIDDRFNDVSCDCEGPYLSKQMCATSAAGLPVAKELQTDRSWGWVSTAAINGTAIAGEETWLYFGGSHFLSTPENDRSLDDVSLGFSSVAGTCDIISESTDVEEGTKRALVRAPATPGLYTVCAKWRTDYFPLHGSVAHGGQIRVAAADADLNDVFKGFASCGGWADTTHDTFCGCRVSGGKPPPAGQSPQVWNPSMEQGMQTFPEFAKRPDLAMGCCQEQAFTVDLGGFLGCARRIPAQMDVGFDVAVSSVSANGTGNNENWLTNYTVRVTFTNNEEEPRAFGVRAATVQNSIGGDISLTEPAVWYMPADASWKMCDNTDGKTFLPLSQDNVAHQCIIVPPGDTAVDLLLKRAGKASGWRAVVNIVNPYTQREGADEFRRTHDEMVALVPVVE